MQHIIIVGAGLGGLLTACLLERGGARVTIVDPVDPGGRARSPELAGFPVNLGPHALYERGPFASLLKHLGIDASGEPAPTAFELASGRIAPMFTGPADLFRPGQATTFRQRVELAAAYAGIIAGRDSSPLESFRASVARQSSSVRERLLAVARLATYSTESADLPNRVIREQLALAAGGVRYVTGGWQTIVDQLTSTLSATFIREKARAIEPTTTGVRVETSSVYICDEVVLAMPWTQASRLWPKTDNIPQPEPESSPPIRTAISTLDVVTRDFEPRYPFVLGVDEAVYFSDNGPIAGPRLPSHRVLHVAHYGGATRHELESLLEQFAPDWRSQVVDARYLPHITVCEHLPGHRLDARWHPRITGVGDWTDTAGDHFLADAVASSAVAAAARLTRGIETFDAA